LKINFILPENDDKPIGGFKIVYQYANEMTKRGHEVCISFLNDLYPEKRSKSRQWLSLQKRRIKHKIQGSIDPSSQITWFDLDKKVEVKFHVINESQLPNADVVIATAVQTSFFVDKLSSKKGRKFYFIQNYETWAYPEDKVHDSFKLPLKKIVIAKWLAEKIKKVTNDYIYIVPNFIDDIYMGKTSSDRENVVSILNHELPEKNTLFGIDVIKRVKEKVPDLTVKMFGVSNRPPEGLPKYISYYSRPSRQQLFNDIYAKSKIYIMPSLLEGWGLTGTEAMASGAALVASDIPGITEYAINNRNSLLAKPNDLKDFSEKVLELILDEKRRKEITEVAKEDVKKYSLIESTNLFLKCLK
jgi:glycosyltransferase involved in cell wall biosynthesis